MWASIALHILLYRSHLILVGWAWKTLPLPTRANVFKNNCRIEEEIQFQLLDAICGILSLIPQNNFQAWCSHTMHALFPDNHTSLGANALYMYVPRTQLLREPRYKDAKVNRRRAVICEGIVRLCDDTYRHRSTLGWRWNCHTKRFETFRWIYRGHVFSSHSF